eukprot:3935068-Rhodomonas_salina.1
MPASYHWLVGSGHSLACPAAYAMCVQRVRSGIRYDRTGQRIGRAEGVGRSNSSIDPGSTGATSATPVPDIVYTPKSNTRKRMPGTPWTEIAVSCIGFRSVGRYLEGTRVLPH